jgi:hypothetical protein
VSFPREWRWQQGGPRLRRHLEGIQDTMPGSSCHRCRLVQLYCNLSLLVLLTAPQALILLPQDAPHAPQNGGRVQHEPSVGSVLFNTVLHDHSIPSDYSSPHITLLGLEFTPLSIPNASREGSEESSKSASHLGGCLLCNLRRGQQKLNQELKQLVPTSNDLPNVRHR